MKLTRFSGTVLASLAVTATASAQQVFLDQQPTRTFSLQCTQGVEANAENFVVAPGPGISMNTIRIWGTWISAGVNQPDTFDVVFHGNNSSGPFGDVPGATLSSVSGVTPAVVATGSMMPTQAGLLPEYELTLTLPSAETFGPGTYWVELYSTNSSGSSDVFVWGMAAQDATNGGPCISWSTSTPGVSWNACTPFPASDMAIVLSNETSTVGTNFCASLPNSTGVNGTLAGSGSDVAADNDLTLIAGELPVGQFGIFVVSQTVDNMPVGQGILCLGGQIGRYNQPSQILQADASGEFSLALDLTAIPEPMAFVSATAGDTFNFQAWHRDGTAMNPQSNFTDGLQVTFQ